MWWQPHPAALQRADSGARKRAGRQQGKDRRQHVTDQHPPEGEGAGTLLLVPLKGLHQLRRLLYVVRVGAEGLLQSSSSTHSTSSTNSNRRC